MWKRILKPAEKKDFGQREKNTFFIPWSERMHSISNELEELMLIIRNGVEFSNMLQRWDRPATQNPCGTYQQTSILSFTDAQITLSNPVIFHFPLIPCIYLLKILHLMHNPSLPRVSTSLFSKTIACACHAHGVTRNHFFLLTFRLFWRLPVMFLTFLLVRRHKNITSWHYKEERARDCFNSWRTLHYVR